MENGAFKLLESATHRTLHAQNFARSSSQASLVLTDLLSRYLNLLVSTCAKYSSHAGRTNISARDALSSLEEMGISLDELSDYCMTEGRELARYAPHTARRMEDLHDFRGQYYFYIKYRQTSALYSGQLSCTSSRLTYRP
jgi:histone H3/H4